MGFPVELAFLFDVSGASAPIAACIGLLPASLKLQVLKNLFQLIRRGLKFLFFLIA